MRNQKRVSCWRFGVLLSAVLITAEGYAKSNTDLRAEYRKDVEKLKDDRKNIDKYKEKIKKYENKLASYKAKIKNHQDWDKIKQSCQEELNAKKNRARLGSDDADDHFDFWSDEHAKALRGEGHHMWIRNLSKDEHTARRKFHNRCLAVSRSGY